MRKVSMAIAAVVASLLVIAALSGSVAAASDRSKTTGRGADVAALHALQATFHESISGGGNIDELASVWAEDATFTAGGTTHSGRDQIRSFFLTTGGFTHNWVSVSPAFKTRIHV